MLKSGVREASVYDEVPSAIDRDCCADSACCYSGLPLGINSNDLRHAFVVNVNFSVETNAPTSIGGCRQTLRHFPILRKSLCLNGYGGRNNSESAHKNVFNFFHKVRF